MRYSVSISGKHYQELQTHLYPGDNREAVAIALCGRYNSEEHIKLLVHEIVPIPYEECNVRESDLLTWSTECIIPSLQKANKYGFSVIKIHCHPGGCKFFSQQDDRADADLFPSIFGWIDDAPIHASCIMLPNGEIFGRIFNEEHIQSPVDKVTIIGDIVKIWYANDEGYSEQEHDMRNLQAFGEGTINVLKKLKVAVVGCSGTGSPVIEQLVRLGVGELLIIDPDIVEKKNLNRILNSTLYDAEKKRKKVDVLKEAGDKVGFGTKITPIDKDIYDDISIVKQIASSDFIVGCLDTIDARHLLNQIATFYLLPYLDIGAYLKSDGKGSMEYICGKINYIQPGGSSLLSRGLYTSELLRGALTKKYNPDAYEELKKEKYIVDVNVDSPAVISVNMQLAATAINEFLARIHGFREDETYKYSAINVDILGGYMLAETDGEPDLYLTKYVGRGDNISPFLNMTEFS